MILPNVRHKDKEAGIIYAQFMSYPILIFPILITFLHVGIEVFILNNYISKVCILFILFYGFQN